MPRPFRIAKDTGMKEYDDSFEPFEGKCPKCKKLHKGNWDVCNECLNFTLNGDMANEFNDSQSEADYWDGDESDNFMQ